MHKNEPICQKCAINCGIEGNASNENITKYKNLSGVKSISNSVQWLARYRIVALISIGRLCRHFKTYFRQVKPSRFAEMKGVQKIKRLVATELENISLFLEYFHSN